MHLHVRMHTPGRCAAIVRMRMRESIYIVRMRMHESDFPVQAHAQSMAYAARA